MSLLTKTLSTESPGNLIKEGREQESAETGLG